MRYIQELLGYQSSKTTEIYTYASKHSLGKFKSPLDNLADKLLISKENEGLIQIEYYEKTLSFNPNDGMAKQMIKDLKGKSKDKSNNQKIDLR